MNYWQERNQRTQARLTSKNIKETEAQLRKYYGIATERTVKEFLATYDKLMKTVVRDNHTPTPADLYRLEAYWKLQAELKQELQKLGAKQISKLSTVFINHWMEVYDSLPIDTGNFIKANKETAIQMINHIWCADGKTWSDRVWQNTDKLQQALNDGLIECVLAGRDEKYLKQQLVNQFGVSYSRADSVVRTELAHIQTQASAKRYEDAGLKQFEVWADEDERRCDICGALHEKRFYIGEQIPIPAHPRCRCCIIPVIE